MLCRLTKCCFCFPLRSGLIAFGYICLIILYLNIISIICHMSDLFQGLSSTDPMNYIILSLALGVNIIQFFFDVILLVGLHKGSTALLEAYYECNLCMLITQMVIAGLYIPLQAYRSYPTLKNYVWLLSIIMIFCGALVIVCQFYLTSLVRSQLRAMKHAVVREEV
ncbi:unnamed protein product [Pieris macdunnoughi]|uniref:Uncharacterized protein n=1 Tax=Pieris macdunnoughi TaxID=345717 RepID=A0A821SE70_9NEOP|nr:unnamed protein product [Pieris macdunnoughi]